MINIGWTKSRIREVAGRRCATQRPAVHDGCRHVKRPEGALGVTKVDKTLATTARSDQDESSSSFWPASRHELSQPQRLAGWPRKWVGKGIE